MYVWLRKILNKILLLIRNVKKMEKNIITLGKYLIYKGVTSPLELQKILFFLRYEELKRKELNDSFFKTDHNFQAWIFGPVNPESYAYFDSFFTNKSKEAKKWLLNDDKIINLLNQKYEVYFNKWFSFASGHLARISRNNLAWIKARGGIAAHQKCEIFMEENTEDFIKFEENN